MIRGELLVAHKLTHTIHVHVYRSRINTVVTHKNDLEAVVLS